MADVPPGAGRGRSDDQSRGVDGHADFSDFDARRRGALFRPRSARPLCARGAAELSAGARGSLAAASAGRPGAAVAVTVLVAFLAIFAFAAVIAEEMSLLGPAAAGISAQHRVEAAHAPQGDTAAARRRRTSPGDRRAASDPKRPPRSRRRRRASAGKAAAEPASAAAGRGRAARADAAGDRRDRDRPFAAAAGNGWAGHRPGHLHPARARGAARPRAQARRRRRPAPHHRGDERGGAAGQPLSAVAALGQCRRGHLDRGRPGGHRHPECGAVGHPRDIAALYPLSRHRHRRRAFRWRSPSPSTPAGGCWRGRRCCSSRPSSSSPTWSSPGFTPAAPACPRSR